MSRILLTTALISSSVFAGDWTQILGPNRDGMATGEKLIAWSESGPKELWTIPVGEGFAGVAVRGSLVVLFHRQGQQERVTGLDAWTGKSRWEEKFPVSYQSGLSSDSGPRCVPVLHKDRIIVFGVTGQLRCLNLETGKQIWSRDTWEDFGAPEGYFGAGSTPVVHDDKVIVNVGSQAGAAVVAFDLADGKTRWKAFNDTASYSSPIIAKVNNVSRAIVVTRLNCLILDPANGKVVNSFSFGARGPTVNGATPVVVKDHFFLSSSYRIGSVWADLTGSDVKRRGESLLATQYATPIVKDGLLYAIDGRQDGGDALVKCIDPVAGEVVWEKGGFEYGSMIGVGNELLFLTCGGELIRIGASNRGYREISRSTVLDPTPRGHRLPALSNGRLYVRDDDNLRCLQVGEIRDSEVP